MAEINIDLLLDHPPIAYFEGPIGSRNDWIVRQMTARLHATCPHPSDPDRLPSEQFRIVYILRNSYSNTVVYVGKTKDLPARFDAHRKRDWWQFVDHVELNLVSCSHDGECDELDRATFLVENMAIGNLRPLANKFIPQTFAGCA